MMVNLPCLMVSCTNFLRPTCSYTECLLSFRTGSCPTEWITAGYSSCLYFDITDLFIPQGTGIPWTHPLLHFLLVIVLMQLSMQLHRYRVSYPEPCPISELSGTRQGSGIFILTCLCYKFFLLFLPFNVRKHLFRIIRSSLLHNRIDDSQKLAGNHDQRLHLFERILCSGRVVYVKLLKFISMCYRWLCRLE